MNAKIYPIRSSFTIVQRTNRFNEATRWPVLFTMVKKPPPTSLSSSKHYDFEHRRTLVDIIEGIANFDNLRLHFPYIVPIFIKWLTDNYFSFRLSLGHVPTLNSEHFRFSFPIAIEKKYSIEYRLDLSKITKSK